MEQANEELARDDLRQASEKGWGAASQIVKAVAEERGWEHNWVIGSCTMSVSLLVEESGDRRTQDALCHSQSICTSTSTRAG